MRSFMLEYDAPIGKSDWIFRVKDDLSAVSDEEVVGRVVDFQNTPIETEIEGVRYVRFIRPRTLVDKVIRRQIALPWDKFLKEAGAQSPTIVRLRSLPEAHKLHLGLLRHVTAKASA